MSHFEDSLDSVDASLFTGDSLFDKEKFFLFYTFLHRWKNQWGSMIDVHFQEEVRKKLNVEELSDDQIKKIDKLLSSEYKDESTMLEYIWKDFSDNYNDRNKGLRSRFSVCVNHVSILITV